MPNDSRRLTGPDNVHSPYDYRPSLPPLDVKALAKERPDGRLPNQLRPLFLKAGVVTQARGSAYIELGQTKVICAVYGPREVIRREDFSLHGILTCDFKFTPFSCIKRRNHQQDNQERDFSVQMMEALEPAICLHKYPKSQINIYTRVLQNDGSALSTAITCASMALAVAGIEMFDLVLATSTAVMGQIILVDPTAEEEESILSSTETSDIGGGSMTLAYLPSIRQVSAITSDGQVSFDTLSEVMKVSIENCQKLYPVVGQALCQQLAEKARDKT